jgi:hypothetical protein
MDSPLKKKLVLADEGAAIESLRFEFEKLPPPVSVWQCAGKKISSFDSPPRDSSHRWTFGHSSGMV